MAEKLKASGANGNKKRADTLAPRELSGSLAGSVSGLFSGSLPRGCLDDGAAAASVSQHMVFCMGTPGTA